MNYVIDIFEQFDKKWALLTAGTKEKFNSMTISWGGMGTLWGKPIVTTYVRSCLSKNLISQICLQML